jgi:DNA-binding response OmpR family regulator
LTPVNGSILLVEDEQDIASLVRAYLERDGFRVVRATTALEGRQALEREELRLAILDLHLPDGDGLDLCRLIRARSQLPVLILTARDDEVDRVTGFGLGADDYVPKPFSPRELAARVRAVLRRCDPDPDEHVLRLGDIRVDLAGRTVRVDDRDVELTRKELDLLAYFARHPNIVLTRERLLDRVWGLQFAGGTRTVDVHVGQLRRKLGANLLIKTARGAGYRAVPPRCD